MVHDACVIPYLYAAFMGVAVGVFVGYLIFGSGWMKTKTVESLARLVVERVLSVYREDYIERCVREEPDSLLALVKRLERALEAPGA